MDMRCRCFLRTSGLVYLIYLVFAMPCYAQAESETGSPKLAKGNGFILADLDVESSSAVLTLEGKRHKRLQVNLIANNGRWVLQSVPKGEYQIVDVKVPYFDLPYRINTKEKPSWKIKVQAGCVNYIGRIEIARERTEEHIDIKKINRLFSNYKIIKSELSGVIAVYPLVDGNYLRDDLAAELLKKEVSRD